MGTEKETLDSPTTRRFEQAPTTALSVTLVAGSIDVVATHDGGPATLDLHEITGPPLTVSHQAGTLRIEQLKDESGQMWSALGSLFSSKEDPNRPTARLTVSVPVEASVTIKTASADVLAGGSHGPIAVYTASGDVTLDRPTGSVDISTAGGDIDCASPSGELSVKTATGGVTVQDAVLRTVRLNTVSGEAVLDLRHGPTVVTANAVSGNVSIRLPADVGYDVTASSLSGRVVVDGETVRDEGKRGGHRYRGDRSVAVKSRTVSGNLVLLRSGAAPGPVLGEQTRPADGIQDEVRPRPDDGGAGI